MTPTPMIAKAISKSVRYRSRNESLCATVVVRARRRADRLVAVEPPSRVGVVLVRRVVLDGVLELVVDCGVVPPVWSDGAAPDTFPVGVVEAGGRRVPRCRLVTGPSDQYESRFHEPLAGRGTPERSDDD